MISSKLLILINIHINLYCRPSQIAILFLYFLLCSSHIYASYSLNIFHLYIPYSCIINKYFPNIKVLYPLACMELLTLQTPKSDSYRMKIPLLPLLVRGHKNKALISL